METRQLGNSDLKLTTVGLGTWAIGGPWKMGWGSQQDEDSIAAIQASLDAGINWIDTAPAYGLGHAEKVVGRAIKGRRDTVIVATKCGLVPNDEGAVDQVLKAGSVRQEIDDSLRRLDVDVIDLLQIHWPIPDEDIEEAWEVLAEAREAGKIRWAGVSNFSVEQLERVGKIMPVTSLQPPYSMLRRAIEDSQLPYCHKNKIGIVAYSPMVSGLLTGKVTHEYVKNLPEDDFRKGTREFKEPNLSINIEFVDNILRPIALANGVQPAQVAIAWTLRGGMITSAIVGARDRKQAESNVRAGELKLSPEETDKIEAGLKDRQNKLDEAGATA